MKEFDTIYIAIPDVQVEGITRVRAYYHEDELKEDLLHKEEDGQIEWLDEDRFTYRVFQVPALPVHTEDLDKDFW